jgi:cytochrome c553
MRDVGAYFASKPALPGLADDSVIKAETGPETFAQRGDALFRGGRRDTGLPACMACHGPSGRGNPGPAYPELGGQHAKYTKDMLTRFRGGLVLGKADHANAIMAQVAASLSDEDITALASYIEGLHRASADAAAPSAAAPAAATATH